MASGLFNLPPRSTKQSDAALVQKVGKRASAQAAISVKGSGGLLERISTINALVAKNLGKFTDKYEILRTVEQLDDYITESIKNGIIAIDTETDGLDPMQNKIAGLCLYTPTRKAVYVPINHISYITRLRVEDQITEQEAAGPMQRLADSDTKIIMFNAKFDIRVIKNQIGVKLTPWWDGYIAARLLNENEGDGNNGLKALHNKYVLQGKGDAFSFESMFKGIPFTLIPIKTGYLYAAHDPEITYELYEFQRPYLTEDDPVCISKGLQRVASLMRNIEMPVVSVVADLEDTGITFDFEFAAKLSEKYNQLLAEKKQKVYDICAQYQQEIDDYKAHNPNNKLDNPINIDSPSQFATLLYDILKVGTVDSKSPRGTGEEILLKIDKPICHAVLEYRGVSKLLSTYIDKLGKVVNPQTGRIHCNFNQIGADTGRFSSSEPNLQNIPSHNKEIRQMFRAADGYVLLSSDYSAQEPRLTAHLSGDPKMIQAYRDGKDLYAEMASLAFGVPYEQCLEFAPDGTKQPEGKERRGRAKAIFLGICYGKGVKAIAEDLNVTPQKAQQIYDSVLKEFPGLKKFMADSERMAKTLGFVETAWGRRRRLPNIQLEPFEFSTTGSTPVDFDPLFDSEDDGTTDGVPEAIKQKYIRQLSRAYGRSQREAIKQKALAEGIRIKENGGLIAEATRQCVNARIQGSAADQTKIAMILVANNQRLKELGFRLLLPVHDELIGECPKENVAEVAPLFSQLMVEAAKDLCVPSKCDVECSISWNGPTLEI